MSRFALVGIIVLLAAPRAHAEVAADPSAGAPEPRLVEVTLAAGVGASTLGDWNRVGESLRGRIAVRWRPSFDAGVDVHVVRGQGVAGATLRAAVGRAYARIGVGVDVAWHGAMTHESIEPVVLAGIGADVVRTNAYKIALELGGFGGDGDPNAAFPDERFGLSLDANVRF